MSGRFPKCMTPGCRRLLIKQTGSQQLTCGGCQKTYRVADLNNATTSDQQSNTSQRNMLSSDDDMQRASNSASAYPSVGQKYPTVHEGGGHNRNSSTSSFTTEKYFMEGENTRNHEKTIIPPNRRPTSYNSSSSSRSISSDEGGSTISRSEPAVSRRTRRGPRSNISEDPTVESLNGNHFVDGMKYDSSYEKESYPLNEAKVDKQAKVSAYQMSVQNSSFNITAPYTNRDTPAGYQSDGGQETVRPKLAPNEINHPVKPSRLNPMSSSDSMSFVSEEDIEETTYQGRRNSYASFDGSNSSRSFSSDEGGSRIGVDGTRFRSKRSHGSRGLSSDNPYDAAQVNRVEKRNMSCEQNDLSDLVNELANLGLTREKLLLVLLKQTEDSIKENSMPKNRNTRLLVRQLSIQIPPSESSDSGRSRGRRKPVTHCCRPLLGGTPFVTCRGCGMLLQLPIGMPAKRFVKIRCGECSELQVCPFPANGVTYNPLHKALGYSSARMLMAPSRQFSLIDDDSGN